MIKEVVRYKCSFCGRLFVRKARAQWHEDYRCLKNPKLAACLTCDHFHGKFNRETMETVPHCAIEQVFGVFQNHCPGWNERSKQYEYWSEPWIRQN
jgi:DNA-directed RNA polymerase subunit RPC12/RpoP